MGQSMNPATGRKAAGHLSGNGLVEGVVIQGAEERNDLSLVIVHVTQAPQQRKEMIENETLIPGVASAAVIVEIEHIVERAKDSTVHIRRGVDQVSQ